MATYFSEHYQPTQAGAVTSATTGHKTRPTASHGRVRCKIATFKNITFATSDVFKAFKLRSSDVVLGLQIVNASGGTDVPGTLGLQKEDGTVVDADFFLADLVFETARAQAAGGSDVTLNVPSVADTTNVLGLTVWEQLALTADPGLIYDVVGVIGTVSAGNAMSFSMFLFYVAGD